MIFPLFTRKHPRVGWLKYNTNVQLLNAKYMEQLSNGIIEVIISPLGAEIQSIKRVASPTEYIWYGDEQYWERRSPVLFPITGRVWQNTARFDGKCYELNIHGFAHDMKFEKIIDEDRHMAFICRADEQSLSHFPFHFELRIDYTLLRNVLTVGWSVTNHDNLPMPFQIGAHPAFLYPHFQLDDDVHGYLSFDAPSPLISTFLKEGFATREHFDIPLPEDGLLPLTNNAFDCDTILDTTSRIHRITLHDKAGRPFVTVRHSMPVTALWSPFGGRAPFICIEPWHGCCDEHGFHGEFCQRPFVESVSAGNTWSTKYELIIE